MPCRFLQFPGANIPVLHSARESPGLPGRRPLERERGSLFPARFGRVRRVVSDVADLLAVQPDLKMRPLEADSNVVPVTLLADHWKLIAILQIRIVSGPAVTRGQPVDVPSDRFGYRAVDDDSDILSGL